METGYVKPEPPTNAQFIPASLATLSLEERKVIALESIAVSLSKIASTVGKSTYHQQNAFHVESRGIIF